jgi:hypothetical protein
VRSVVVEAVRVSTEAARLCGKQIPVWVYTWQRYHDGVSFINCSADESMFWTESFAAGADGLVLWGSERLTLPQFQHFWTSTFAPEVLGWN